MAMRGVNSVYSSKGQNLTEVALIFGIAGLVLFGMQAYITRGLQAKTKKLTDYMIGTEQEAYQQDVSGLEVNTSEFSFKQDSTTTLKQSIGGAKSIVSQEVLESEYESESKE
jgi:hypothetical protein